jgi:hypothetical protein
LKVEVFSCRYCGEEIALLIWLGDGEDLNNAQMVAKVVDLPAVACQSDRYFIVYPEFRETTEDGVDDYLCGHYFKHKCDWWGRRKVDDA